LPPIDAKAKQEIEHFLQPQLRHHRHAQSTSPPSRLLQRFDEAMHAACVSVKPNPTDFLVLDVEFDDVLRISASLIQELSSRLAGERADHVREIENARQVIDGKQREI